MSTYAILNASNQVVSTILWDGDTTKWQPPAGTTVALFTSSMVWAPIPIEQQNAQTLQQQARTAMVNNRTYLAIAAPLVTDTTAQIAALTRQMNGVIRQLLSQFDATN